MFKIICLNLLICLLLLPGCFEKEEVVIEETTYENPDLGFKFDIPEEWKAVILPIETDEPQNMVIKISDPDNDAIITFTVKKQHTTAKEAALVDLQNLRYGAHHKFDLISKQPFGIGYMIENWFTEADITVYQKRFYVSNTPLVYVIMISSPKKEIADIYMPFYDSVIESLKLTEVKGHKSVFLK